jgi:hypothetical protein
VTGQYKLSLGRIVVRFLDNTQLHTHTKPEGVPWTSDQLVAEAATWQHTINARDEYPCPQRDTNPQHQQPNGLRLHGHRDRPFNSLYCTKTIPFNWIQHDCQSDYLQNVQLLPHRQRAMFLKHIFLLNSLLQWLREVTRTTAINIQAWCGTDTKCSHLVRSNAMATQKVPVSIVQHNVYVI